MAARRNALMGLTKKIRSEWHISWRVPHALPSLCCAHTRAENESGIDLITHEHRSTSQIVDGETLQRFLEKLHAVVPVRLAIVQEELLLRPNWHGHLEIDGTAV